MLAITNHRCILYNVAHYNGIPLDPMLALLVDHLCLVARVDQRGQVAVYPACPFIEGKLV